MITFLTLAGTSARRTLAAVTTLFLAVTCMAQNDPTAQPQLPSAPEPQTMQSENGAQGQAPGAPRPATETLPAGTRIALVLTHPILSRNVHRGDDIHAQITAPVNSGNQVVIPPGTFVQGTVDKLELRGGRAELHLQSMSITFPDGYVAPVAGPITMQSEEGYVLKDPGHRRGVGAFILPFAGAGLGALIGHSVGTSQDTLTTTLPNGCNPALPNCLSSSMTIPGSKGMDTGIGTTVGAAAGGIASIVLLVGSHYFFLDVGSPVDMMLSQPLSIEQSRVDDAVRQSAEYPVQPIAPRRVSRSLPPDTYRGTCYTPGSPGTPDTVIPGAPGPDGIPGPSTTIPGIPPTPATPYPCP